MKQYNASIYFTYKGSSAYISNIELEQKIQLALQEWLNISDVHVETVDEANE